MSFSDLGRGRSDRRSRGSCLFFNSLGSFCSIPWCPDHTDTCSIVNVGSFVSSCRYKRIQLLLPWCYRVFRHFLASFSRFQHVPAFGNVSHTSFSGLTVPGLRGLPMIVGLSNQKAVLFQDDMCPVHLCATWFSTVFRCLRGALAMFANSMKIAMSTAKLCHQDPFEQFWNEMDPQIMIATPGSFALSRWEFDYDQKASKSRSLWSHVFPTFPCLCGSMWISASWWRCETFRDVRRSTTQTHNWDRQNHKLLQRAFVSGALAAKRVAMLSLCESWRHDKTCQDMCETFWVGMSWWKSRKRARWGGRAA